MRWPTAALIKILIDNGLIAEHYPEFVPQAIDRIFLEFHRLIYSKDIIAYKCSVYVDELITLLENIPNYNISMSNLESLLKIKDGNSKKIERIYRSINKLSSFHKAEAVKLCISLNHYCTHSVNYFPKEMGIDLTFILSTLYKIKNLLNPLLGETNRYMSFVYTKKVYQELKNIQRQHITVKKFIKLFKLNQEHSVHFAGLLLALKSNNHSNNKDMLLKGQAFLALIKRKIIANQHSQTLDKNEILEFIEPLVDHFDFPLTFLLPLINQFKAYCKRAPSNKHLSEVQLYMALSSNFLVAASYGCSQPIVSSGAIEKLNFIRKCHPIFWQTTSRVVEMWGQKCLTSLLATNPQPIINQFRNNVLDYGNISYLGDYLFYLNDLPLNPLYNHFCLSLLEPLTVLATLSSTLLNKQTLLQLLKITCKHLIVAIQSASQQLHINAHHAETLLDNLRQLSKRYETFGVNNPSMKHQADLLDQNKEMIGGALKLFDANATPAIRIASLEQINQSLNRASGTHYALRPVLNELFLNSPNTRQAKPKRQRSITIDSIENYVKAPMPRK